MRPPRYKFPDQVRSTTRAMAARMVQDKTIAQTPEELEAWIAGAPTVRDSLQSGGYGTAFTSQDLLPLLQVFIEQAGGARASADAPVQRPSNGRRVVWLVLGALVVLLLIALALGLLP